MSGMKTYLYCQNIKKEWANWNRTETSEAAPYTYGKLYNKSDVRFIGNDEFLARENGIFRKKEKNWIRGDL